MENHRESRKRLRPWLERMINSGECPGLVWENRDDRTFRIPWRHFNNKEWVEEDSKIFREWAKYTGKYQDGDKVEYPVWKTRLRCALKKIPEIKEIPDMHRIEDANPYRVYKFVDVPLMKRPCEFDTDSCHSQSSNMSHHIIDDQPSPSPPNFLDSSYIAAEKPANVPTVVFDEDVYRLQTKKESPDFLYYEDNKDHIVSTVMQNFCEKSYQPVSHLNFEVPPILEENVLQSSEPMTSLPSDLKSVNTDDLCLLANMELPNSMTSITNTSNLSMEVPNVGTGAIVSAPPSSTCMHVLVYYGTPSVQVTAHTIPGVGCRFFSPNFGPVSVNDSRIEETLFGPKNVFQIALPSPEQYLNDNNCYQEQKPLISDLLEKMERGVVLTNIDSDIYVQRLCRTRIFLTDGASDSMQLDRKGNTVTKAFDFKKFLREYEEYRHGLKKDLPKPFFMLTLGQEIKKSHYNPMGNILIHVVVKHDLATKIIAQDPNANNSSSGVFYSYDSYDKFLEEVKKVQIV
ncbi:interferon regulatory factor 8 [Biomphalaria glabrata]|nr:interferon regulatory factor 8 [Biomphalaria glabrata]